MHGLHHKSPKVVKLVHGLHHGCQSGDHGCAREVKLVMGLHRGSPMVVKLEVGLHRGGYIREHEVFRGASPPKVPEGEVHDGTSLWNSKKCKASVGVSSHGFPHPCEPMSGRLHKWD